MNDNTNLTITEVAKKQILKILNDYFTEHGISPFLKIKVLSKGCSGLAYDIELIHSTVDKDVICDYNDFKIIISPEALMWTINTTLDYIEDECEERFIFKNDLQKRLCHCKQAFYPKQ